MLTVEPTGAVLGATIRGLNAAEPISDHDLGVILAALGRHGVLRIPEQSLAEDDIRRFSQMFGDIQGPSGAPLGPDGKEVPHVGILSNIKENGKYIGAADAGQDWHTDMSYRDVIGFVNILYGVKVPVRDGKPLGGTEFSNMHAVYDALPDELKRRLADATTTHDFEKFWEHMRRDKASGRPPMTEEQRRRRPPVKHPLFMTHPITGKKVLYCNPGYVTRINELPAAESDALLEYLFDFQLQDRFRYTHQWA
jgi:taurine dioxygenase